MNAIHCPGYLEFLIHCHVNPCPHPMFGTPLIQDAIKHFESLECIMHDKDGRYRTTGRGDALIVALCNTPAPTSAWIDEQGRVLK